MVKSIIIKCPFCDSKAELFLSINPTVIVLNCPECWTPLMYDNSEIRILSDHELNKIATPSVQSVINNNAERNKNATMDAPQTKDKNLPFLEKKSNSNVLVPVPHSGNRGVISNDEIINLRIDLAQSFDVLDFIEKI